MRSPLLFALVCAASAAPEPIYGGYTMVNRMKNNQSVGLDNLQALAENAKTLPLNRLWLAFASPNMMYKAGDNTLHGTGLETKDMADGGFAKLKEYVAEIRASGIEVFLSVGGWDYNCFSYIYARYSVGGYGTHTPNYWSINKYGQGNVDNCKDSNNFCYVCEPRSQKEGLKDFQLFPEPHHADTTQSHWKAAIKKVEELATAAGMDTPVWNPDIVPGRQWTDPKTQIEVKIPGDPRFVKAKSDPYYDAVVLAKDLDLDGIDLDYEEFWHADYFKTVDNSTSGATMKTGPWKSTQTTYKYAAIANDMKLAIDEVKPTLKLSTAAGAASAWKGSWWGGNLKGVMYQMNKLDREMIDFMSTSPNAGGINVMSYDLSNNQDYHECPDADTCSLSEQVEFYMKTYKDAGITAAVGYEVGYPAYPSAEDDPQHQLPLKKDGLEKILSSTQKGDSAGGFMWALHKSTSGSQASVTETLQAICKAVNGEASRCEGNVPTQL
jgi:hypothetical protein